MKKSQHNFGSSLFLMEMSLALLFLSLSCAACIQIFAAARSNRSRAEQLNQIQTLTTSVGEALEGTDGSADEILELIPDGVQEDPDINWYYDNAWKICPRDSAVYVMTFTPDTSSQEKSGTLTFCRTSDNTELYQISLRFPACDFGKEDSK